GPDDGEEDQRSAHRGRALLGEVRLRAVRALHLPALLGAQDSDEAGAGEQAQDQRRHGGAARAESDVLEDVERPERVAQLIEVEEHQRALASSSSFIAREALNSTASPDEILLLREDEKAAGASPYSNGNFGFAAFSASAAGFISGPAR